MDVNGESARVAVAVHDICIVGRRRGAGGSGDAAAARRRRIHQARDDPPQPLPTLSTLLRPPDTDYYHFWIELDYFILLFNKLFFIK